MKNLKQNKNGFIKVKGRKSLKSDPNIIGFPLLINRFDQIKNSLTYGIESKRILKEIKENSNLNEIYQNIIMEYSLSKQSGSFKRVYECSQDLISLIRYADKQIIYKEVSE